MNLLWQIFYALGQINMPINGQLLKNSLAIWSHWNVITFVPQQKVLQQIHLSGAIAWQENGVRQDDEDDNSY